MSRKFFWLIALVAAATSASQVFGATDPVRPLLSATTGSEQAPSAVFVKRVRLEAAPRPVPQPSALLKFEMFNESDHGITDVVIEIAIRSTVVDAAGTSAFIVRPFRVANHAVIDAGYSIDYELTLQNLAPACECVADVHVASARAVDEPAR